VFCIVAFALDDAEKSMGAGDILGTLDVCGMLEDGMSNDARCISGGSVVACMIRSHKKQVQVVKLSRETTTGLSRFITA